MNPQRPSVYEAQVGESDNQCVWWIALALGIFTQPLELVSKSRMPTSHLKAMRAIEHCRTEALGGQVYRCPNCEQLQYSYHSRRNRHCPKCQNENAQSWLARHQDLLLPVPYCLLTFTLSAGFNKVARA